MDGRYKAKLVAGDEYLLKLTRYVHQNPVWVSDWVRKPIRERIAHLRGYRWSSYPGYIGQTEPFEFIDEEPILAMVGGKGRLRRERYREFVETGLAATDQEFKAALRASPCAIGDEEFLHIAKGRLPRPWEWPPAPQSVRRTPEFGPGAKLRPPDLYRNGAGLARG